jgi:DNA polymerase kappa
VDKVAMVIKSATKNSEYYKTEERRLIMVKQKVAKYKSKIARAKDNKSAWATREFEVKRKVITHAKDLDTSRTWVHVDMDMFYAAVSWLDRN